jgi:filamentous hemagglutinin family protein
MIFDSPKMHAMRTKYLDRIIFGVPPIVLLDRNEERVLEQDYLERLITEVKPEKQKEWLKKRLFSTSWEQFLAGQFEMFLYGWLQQLGSVIVEPVLGKGKPDFLLRTDQQDIIIEAKAHPISDAKRKEIHLEYELFNRIRTIQLPYVIEINALQLCDFEEINILIEKIEDWLKNNPGEKFIYNTQKTIMVASINTELRSTNENSVYFIYNPNGIIVDGKKLVSSILAKAKKYNYSEISDHPYIIAYFIEADYFGGEEVVEAWFGKTQYSIDFETNQINGVSSDLDGIAYKFSKISPKVSGLLVFKYNPARINPVPLKGWYIQNPYAKYPIDPSLFPVDSRFIVQERNDQYLSMGWIRDWPDFRIQKK